MICHQATKDAKKSRRQRIPLVDSFVFSVAMEEKDWLAAESMIRSLPEDKPGSRSTMNFRIADSFTDSLARLTDQEQKAVKTTAFDLQMDPAGSGLSFHRLERARDRNFWSVRVNRDLRIIVHRTDGGLMLCYADHHDGAYRWAERRKIETHPRTGAAQIVELRERVEEIIIRQPVTGAETAAAAAEAVAPPPSAAPPLFTNVPADDLLRYGVPPEWLDEVCRATEDTLFDLADHLPQEAAEALLDLATGSRPAPPVARPPEGSDPFAHPDAQRRFRVLANVEELQRALAYPWEKWTVFLHPVQRSYVERDYSGPARIAGSAGTGKTIVALHRAVHLARRHPDARILLTTFSSTLAQALKTKLSRLVGPDDPIRQRITVESILSVAARLYEDRLGVPRIAARADLKNLLTEAGGKAASPGVSPTFLLSEWTEVVDAWQIKSWEAYRDVPRLGRKTRLSGKQRAGLWTIFEQVRAGLVERSLVTWADVLGRLTTEIQETGNGPFDFAIIDEAQDMGVPVIRFLAALGGTRPDALFFTGDLGQRIFQTPFSWKALGVDVRGRSHTLKVNYRTSHQIRSQADRLLAKSLSDVDGIVEGRTGTVSVFNGPPAEILVFASEQDERDAVAAWIRARRHEGYRPQEIGVFVRGTEQAGRAARAVETAGVAAVLLEDDVETAPDKVSVSTMHRAKGLEFRAVVVMACDEEVLPCQDRIEAIADAADFEEVFDTERHLLYVACTRARDRLLVTGVEPESEFLDDLQ